jgi:hypothetical protein
MAHSVHPDCSPCSSMPQSPSRLHESMQLLFARWRYNVWQEGVLAGLRQQQCSRLQADSSGLTSTCLTCCAPPPAGLCKYVTPGELHLALTLQRINLRLEVLLHVANSLGVRLRSTSFESRLAIRTVCAQFVRSSTVRTVPYSPNIVVSSSQTFMLML